MFPYSRWELVPKLTRAKGGVAREWVAPSRDYTGFYPDAQPDFASLRVTQRGWMTRNTIRPKDHKRVGPGTGYLPECPSISHTQSLSNMSWTVSGQHRVDGLFAKVHPFTHGLDRMSARKSPRVARSQPFFTHEPSYFRSASKQCGFSVGNFAPQLGVRFAQRGWYDSRVDGD